MVFTAARLVGDTTTGLVIPVVSGKPTYPTAGKVVRQMKATVTCRWNTDDKGTSRSHYVRRIGDGDACHHDRRNYQDLQAAASSRHTKLFVDEPERGQPVAGIHTLPPVGAANRSSIEMKGVAGVVRCADRSMRGSLRGTWAKRRARTGDSSTRPARLDHQRQQMRTVRIADLARSNTATGTEDD